MDNLIAGVASIHAGILNHNERISKTDETARKFNQQPSGEELVLILSETMIKRGKYKNPADTLETIVGIWNKNAPTRQVERTKCIHTLEQQSKPLTLNNTQ